MMKIPDSKIQCPGPRYTSYPTVPYWNETEFTYDNWIPYKIFIESNSKEGIAYTFTCHFVKVCVLLWLQQTHYKKS
jgi:hypothetical protein